MEYKNLYTEFLKKYIKVEKPLTVVFDASNGPAGSIIKDLFQATQIKVILINDEIDPDFKAHGPNPLLPGAIDQCSEAVIKHGAHMGVLYDADADRAFFLDNKGEMLPACFIVGLLNQVFSPPYVADELVFQSLRMLNIVNERDLLPTRIGAYFIKEKLRENNATFGAEFSGHYYFKDFFNVDSGIFATIAVINSLSEMDVDLSVWREKFGVYESITKEIKIEDGKNMNLLYEELEDMFAGSAKIIDKRDGITFVFNNFWINTRTSNTEPIMRIIGQGSPTEMLEVIKVIEDKII